MQFATPFTFDDKVFSCSPMNVSIDIRDGLNAFVKNHPADYPTKRVKLEFADWIASMGHQRSRSPCLQRMYSTRGMGCEAAAAITAWAAAARVGRRPATRLAARWLGLYACIIPMSMGIIGFPLVDATRGQALPPSTVILTPSRKSTIGWAAGCCWISRLVVALCGSLRNHRAGLVGEISAWPRRGRCR